MKDLKQLIYMDENSITNFDPNKDTIFIDYYVIGEFDNITEAIECLTEHNFKAIKDFLIYMTEYKNCNVVLDIDPEEIPWEALKEVVPRMYLEYMQKYKLPICHIAIDALHQIPMHQVEEYWYVHAGKLQCKYWLYRAKK